MQPKKTRLNSVARVTGFTILGIGGSSLIIGDITQYELAVETGRALIYLSLTILLGRHAIVASLGMLRPMSSNDEPQARSNENSQSSHQEKLPHFLDSDLEVPTSLMRSPDTQCRDR